MRLNPVGILALGLCALFVGLLAWSLLSAIAGWLLVACLTLALWRLWRAAYGPSDPVSSAPPDRSSSPPPPAPPGADPAKRAARRRLDQALTELDGMVGLAAVKAE